MEVILSPKAAEHLQFWKNSGNKIVLKKIQELILSIEINPLEGIGQPEPLRYALTGLWSRRINKEHRLLYDPSQEPVVIISLKGHYDQLS